MNSYDKLFSKKARSIFRKAFGLNLEIKFKRPEKVRHTSITHGPQRYGKEQFECSISDFKIDLEHDIYRLYEMGDMPMFANVFCHWYKTLLSESAIYGCGLTAQESFRNALLIFDIITKWLPLYDQKMEKIVIPEFETLPELELKLRVFGRL